MTVLTRCRLCLVPNGVRLLDDFYPVGPDSLPGDARVRELLLDAEGFCPFCRQYAAGYDETLIEQELLSFVAGLTSPALVAVSGGKDSMCALFLMKQVLRLPVRAFTYDNGFIPAAVLEQTRRICAELGVEHETVTHSLVAAFKDEFRPDASGLLQSRTGLDFCRLCAGEIRKVMLELCLRDGLEHVVFGNKTYTSLQPQVSCLKALVLPDGHRVLTINLLYALKTSVTQQQNMLADMGWKDPGLEGYTSNCRVPGLVAGARARKLGMPSDAGYIEMELRSGAYTRAEAEELIDFHTEFSGPAAEEISLIFGGDSA